jgi:hypothetical protein
MPTQIDGEPATGVHWKAAGEVCALAGAGVTTKATLKKMNTKSEGTHSRAT